MFYPWDVENLLSLLESRIPGCPVTNFKLTIKAATVLALSMAKCYSDIPLLQIHNVHLSSGSYCYIFPTYGGKMD